LQHFKIENKRRTQQPIVVLEVTSYKFAKTSTNEQCHYRHLRFKVMTFGKLWQVI